MKKIILALAALYLTMGCVSCKQNKKLEEVTNLLAINFVKMGKYQPNGPGFSPDTMCYEGKDVLIRMAVDKDVSLVPNFSFDKWIKPYVIGSLFSNGVNTIVLGKSLDTKEGGSPEEDYFKLMEQSGAQFKVVVKTSKGDKTYTISPSEATRFMKMSHEEHNLCAASGVFIAQIHEFKTNGVVKNVKIEGNVCCIDLIIDEEKFVSKLETMPAILGYVILNNLELKINNTVIPKEEVKKKWDEAKVSMSITPQEEKGNNMA